MIFNVTISVVAFPSPQGSSGCLQQGQLSQAPSLICSHPCSEEKRDCAHLWYSPSLWHMMDAQQIFLSSKGKEGWEEEKQARNE